MFPVAADAISGNDQVRLAGQGRYDELAAQLEADASKQPLKVPDLHALCFAYSKVKSYTRLFECLESLERAAASGEKRTRLFGLDDVTPTIHIMRAEALVDFSRYDEAITSANEALTWFRRLRSDDKDIEINALAVKVLANAFRGDRDAAREEVKRLEGLELGWKYKDYANAKALALARSNLALERWEKVLESLAQNKAFGFQVFLDNLLSGAVFKGASNWAWQELPRAYMAAKAMKEMGRRAEAKEGYDRLLKTPEVEANGEIYWLILHDRGVIAEDEGDTATAVQLFGRAIDVLEVQRTSINTEANKIGFIGNKQELYARMVRLLMKSGAIDRALEYAERAKSRALVDMLASRLEDGASLKAEGGVAPVLTGYLVAEQKLRLQAPVPAGSGAERRRGVSEAADQLRQVAPEMASLVAVGKPRLEDLRKRLSAQETLLLYYIAGNEGFAFVLSQEALRVVPIPVAGLTLLVERWRAAIQRQDPVASIHGKALYDRLIAPLSAELRTPQLVIVPHGSLHYVSFAALNDGTQYLVDRYALRTLPSASVLEFLRAGGTRTAALLILGNPDRGDSREDLPNAQAEAEALARAYSGSRLLLRKDASETAFTRMSSEYSVIHVASHGRFNGDTPMTSALLLARDAQNDGNLTVSELYAMRLRADLVTLSACETGLGKVSSGDDVVGLGRGFLYAGARSILASLWSVGDEATSYLMLRFYENMATGDKRSALQAAQVETRKRYPHPFFWGAFYLIGAER